MLSVRHLSVSYHKPVFTDVTMDFAQKIYGIQGESGSGKSTFIKAVLGLIPYQGQVLYNGKELKKPKDRRGFQMIFQNPFYSFNPQKTIRSAFDEMHRWNSSNRERSKKTYTDQRNEVISRCLELTGLPEAVLDKYPHAFSGGELQRLAIARALAGNPHVLILDEPTSALDVITQKKLLDDMLPLLKGKTVLLISHDVRVIGYCADEMLILKEQQLFLQL